MGLWDFRGSIHLEILLRSIYQNIAKVEVGLEEKKHCSRVGSGRSCPATEAINPVESQSLEYLGAV